MKHRSHLRGAGALTLAAAFGMFAASAANAQDQAASIEVNTAADTADASDGSDDCADADGNCSLRAAIQTANANGGGQITLAPGTYALTLAGDGGAEAGDLDIESAIELAGTGAIVNLADLGDRAFDVAAGATFTVTGLTVTGGTPAEGESGGAFQNAGILRLDGVRVSDSAVAGEGASGGALYNNGGVASIANSTFVRNAATRAGGAVEASGGSTRITNTTMANNETGPTPGNGGALHLTGAGLVTVAQSDVYGNVASAEGGGLWNSATGSMVVTETTLRANTANGAEADNGGGGLYNDGGGLTVSDSFITANSADTGSGSGGGILNNLGKLTVSNTEVRGNAAERAGGGIEVVDGTTRITGSVLAGNVTGPTPGNGGGLHASGTAAHVTVDQTEVRDNVAALEGGGLWAGGGASTMTVTGSTITGNTANGIEATNGGGGLYNEGGALTVEGSTITGNHADLEAGSGGGILNLGTLTVSDSEISSNTSARAGGGIESSDANEAGNATLTAVELTGNSTGNAPGNGGGFHVTDNNTDITITTTIDGSNVSGNFAFSEGGGLWNFAGSAMTVTNTTVSGNIAAVAPNAYQNGDAGDFTIDGTLVEPGDNDLSVD